MLVAVHSERVNLASVVRGPIGDQRVLELLDCLDVLTHVGIDAVPRFEFVFQLVFGQVLSQLLLFIRLQNALLGNVCTPPLGGLFELIHCGHCECAPYVAFFNWRTLQVLHHYLRRVEQL